MKFKRPKPFVYRLYSENQELLYVGFTYDFDTRIVGHKRKPWFHEIACYTLQRCDSKIQGLQTESLAIYEEQPIHNIRGKIPSNLFWLQQLQKIRQKRLKRLLSRLSKVAKS